MTKRVTQGIDVDRLDQLVKDLGVRVRIYKSTLCPNMTSLESVDHDINCNLCSNNMIDFCPCDSIAMFQQQSLVEAFKIQGTFEIDEILVTFLSGKTLQTQTRVDLIDFEEDFYELVQRQMGDTDNLKYPATAVLGIFTSEGNPKKTVQYYIDIDFQIDNDGNIKWTGSRKPADKAIYSIYYRHHPVYRAIKAVHRDRFSQYNNKPHLVKAALISPGDGNNYIKFPETWVLKRDYLLERRKEDGAKIPDNEYFDPNS